MTEETKQLLALLKAELESAEKSMAESETKEGSIYHYWSGFVDGVGHAISTIKRAKP